jgi:hypothetical protein
MTSNPKLPARIRIQSLGTGSNHGGKIELDPPVIDDVNRYIGYEPPLLDPQLEAQRVQWVLSELSPEEIKQLPDPMMPIRHLRAENGDRQKALGKLKAALTWRQQFDVKGIVNGDYHEIMCLENKTGKIYVRGYDKQGRALIYMNSSKNNTKDEVNNMRHLVWNLERAIACTARTSQQVTGHSLEKYNLLIDFQNFRLRDSPPISTTKFTLDILQKHYPERMHRAYVLHPPFAFTLFWNLIQAFIDPTTKEKIVLCTKKNLHRLHENVPDITKLEACCILSGDRADGAVVREFVSKEYCELPMDISFDE